VKNTSRLLAVTAMLMLASHTFAGDTSSPVTKDITSKTIVAEGPISGGCPYGLCLIASGDSEN
jgi:hypothetical protein